MGNDQQYSRLIDIYCIAPNKRIDGNVFEIWK